MRLFSDARDAVERAIAIASATVTGLKVAFCPGRIWAATAMSEEMTVAILANPPTVGFPYYITIASIPLGH